MPEVLSVQNIRKQGVRPEHFLYFTILSNGPGTVLAWIGHRLGLTPNIVTICGLSLIFPAACLNIIGEPYYALLLFHLFFIFDCADGILARATNQKSAAGAYLDDLAHEVFQPIFVVSLGWGFYHNGDAFASGVCMSAAAMNSLMRSNTELLRHQPSLASGNGGDEANQSSPQRARAAILSSFDYPNMVVGLTATVWHRQALLTYLCYCSAMSVAYASYCGLRVARSGRVQSSAE